MNVTYVHAGAVTAQAARAQRGETTLVRQLGERVQLIHELRHLAAAKELADSGHDWPGRADQALRRDLLRVLNRHALANTALKALEPGAHVHLDQLANRADPSVAEMVDVVRVAQPVVEPNHLADDRDKILVAE